MKILLKKDVLKVISNSSSKMRIALALGVTENTMYRRIKSNSDSLTTKAALKAISKETGIPEKDLTEEVA
jgi:hypothetical protein